MVVVGRGTGKAGQLAEQGVQAARAGVGRLGGHGRQVVVGGSS